MSKPLEKNKLEYLVYAAHINDDADEEFEYVGITKDFERRKKEHLKTRVSNTGRAVTQKETATTGDVRGKPRKIYVISDLLPEYDARIVEQILLDHIGLEYLNNKQNSIDPDCFDFDIKGNKVEPKRGKTQSFKRADYKKYHNQMVKDEIIINPKIYKR